jgi:hypothetical protein
MSRYLYVPFKFENSGSKIIYQQWKTSVIH